jgi:hypothetical protein
MISPMRTGRPPKPAEERRTDSMKLPLSETEKTAIQTAAETIGEKPVTWARETLLKAANRIKKR